MGHSSPKQGHFDWPYQTQEIGHFPSNNWCACTYTTLPCPPPGHNLQKLMANKILWAVLYTQKRIKVHINSQLEHHNSVSTGCISASRSLLPVFFSPILVSKQLSKMWTLLANLHYVYLKTKCMINMIKGTYNHTLWRKSLKSQQLAMLTFLGIHIFTIHIPSNIF